MADPGRDVYQVRRGQERQPRPNLQVWWIVPSQFESRRNRRKVEDDPERGRISQAGHDGGVCE